MKQARNETKNKRKKKGKEVHYIYSLFALKFKKSSLSFFLVNARVPLSRLMVLVFQKVQSLALPAARMMVPCHSVNFGWQASSVSNHFAPSVDGGSLILYCLDDDNSSSSCFPSSSAAGSPFFVCSQLLCKYTVARR